MVRKIFIFAAIILVFTFVPIDASMAEDSLGIHSMGCIIPDYDIREEYPEYEGQKSYSTAALPASVDNSNTPYFPAIGDQGYQGSCASFSSTYYAATYTKNRALGITTTTANTMSPAFTYPLVNSGRDTGSSLFDNMEMLCRTGAPSLSTMPYNSSSTVTNADITKWPTQSSIWEEAIDNKLKDFSYYYYGNGTYDLDIQGIKGLLANGDVVLFSTFFESIILTPGCINLVSNNAQTSLDDSYIGEYIISYQAALEPDGSHAMTLVGYDDYIWNDINGNGTMESAELGAFKIANSWGAGWGNSGFIWVSYDAFSTSSALRPDSTYINPFLSSNYIYVFEAYESAYTPTALCEINVTASDRYAMAIYACVYDEATNIIPSFDATALSSDYGFSFYQNPDPTPLGGIGGSSTGTIVLDVSYDKNISSSNNYTWDMEFYLNQTNPSEGDPVDRAAYQINSASLTVNGGTSIPETTSTTYPLAIDYYDSVVFDYINNPPYVSPPPYYSFAEFNNTVSVSRFYSDMLDSSDVEVPEYIGHYNYVTSIGSLAFANCTGITSITVGRGVTSIADDAFTGCSPGLTFYAHSNSAAAIFAQEKGFDLIVYEDLNDDDIVDLLDIAYVAGNYGLYDTLADRNSDGIVNIFDLTMVAKEIRN